MDKSFEFFLNNKVFYGANKLKELGDIIKNYGYKKIGIIVDKNLLKNSTLVKDVVNDLRIKYKCVFLTYDHPFEPTYEYLESVRYNFISNNKPKVDSILAIGGGSTMDVAKGIAILSTNKKKAEEYAGFPENLNTPLPVITVPSTTGTGSELVYNASFINNKTKVKMGINYLYNSPIFSVLDPNVVSSAPLSVLASSGIDALVHCIEGFSGKNTNPIGKIFAKEAYNKIINNMPKLLKGEGSIENWAEMQWASYFAMVALSNGGGGPTGAMSYFLGVNYNIPHGVAGGIFLRSIVNYNFENKYMDYALLISDQYQCVDDVEKKTKSLKVCEDINALLDLAQIPLNLIELKIDKEDKTDFINFAHNMSGAFDQNPIKIDELDIEKIINKLFI